MENLNAELTKRKTADLENCSTPLKGRQKSIHPVIQVSNEE
jgi:hypothetical protein